MSEHELKQPDTGIDEVCKRALDAFIVGAKSGAKKQPNAEIHFLADEDELPAQCCYLGETVGIHVRKMLMRIARVTHCARKLDQEIAALKAKVIDERNRNVNLKEINERLNKALGEISTPPPECIPCKTEELSSDTIEQQTKEIEGEKYTGFLNRKYRRFFTIISVGKIKDGIELSLEDLRGIFKAFTSRPCQAAIFCSPTITEDCREYTMHGNPPLIAFILDDSFHFSEPDELFSFEFSFYSEEFAQVFSENTGKFFIYPQVDESGSVTMILDEAEIVAKVHNG